MLIFIDESGDSGRKILKGSSQYFVVALVCFNEDHEAFACDQRIQALRSQLGKSPSFEFHFARNSKYIREQFLKAVTVYPFSYHAFALNKDPGKLNDPRFNTKDGLYKSTIQLTFENAKPNLESPRVVIDESGDRKFRDELATYLRRQVRDNEGRRLIEKVKVQQSDGNNLLQLADYVAGIFNRVTLGNLEGIDLHNRYLTSHELTTEVWPK